MKGIKRISCTTWKKMEPNGEGNSQQKRNPQPN